jgi:hypothetical protein
MLSGGKSGCNKFAISSSPPVWEFRHIERRLRGDDIPLFIKTPHSGLNGG